MDDGESTAQMSPGADSELGSGDGGEDDPESGPEVWGATCPGQALILDPTTKSPDQRQVKRSNILGGPT